MRRYHVILIKVILNKSILRKKKFHTKNNVHVNLAMDRLYISTKRFTKNAYAVFRRAVKS